MSKHTPAERGRNRLKPGALSALSNSSGRKKVTKKSVKKIVKKKK